MNCGCTDVGVGSSLGRLRYTTQVALWEFRMSVEGLLFILGGLYTGIRLKDEDKSTR